MFIYIYIYIYSVKLSSTHKSYFLLLHKARFYAPTYFGYLLSLSSENYNIVRTQVACSMLVNGK